MSDCAISDPFHVSIGGPPATWFPISWRALHFSSGIYQTSHSLHGNAYYFQFFSIYLQRKWWWPALTIINFDRNYPHKFPLHVFCYHTWYILNMPVHLIQILNRCFLDGDFGSICCLRLDFMSQCIWKFGEIQLDGRAKQIVLHVEISSLMRTKTKNWAKSITPLFLLYNSGLYKTCPMILSTLPKKGPVLLKEHIADLLRIDVKSVRTSLYRSISCKCRMQTAIVFHMSDHQFEMFSGCYVNFYFKISYFVILRWFKQFSTRMPWIFVHNAFIFYEEEGPQWLHAWIHGKAYHCMAVRIKIAKWTAWRYTVYQSISKRLHMCYSPCTWKNCSETV